MSPDILIVGQGLAGSLLGWALERAGIDFAIADAGPERAASSVAAGLINPVTGRRLVKSHNIDELLPQAVATYQEMEAELGTTLWYPLRVRRLFADDRERATFSLKQETGDLAPYARDGDQAGFWIEFAGRADLRLMLRLLRERWEKQGRLRTGEVDVERSSEYALVIDCRGVPGTRASAFAWVPWEFSKGELLEVSVTGLAPDVVINRRHWIVPVGADRAWVGATNEPDVQDPAPTAAGQALLEATARDLLPQGFVVLRRYGGVRVTLDNKLPVAGRHPSLPSLGLFNGLGAKGVLYGPWVAECWVRHLQKGAPFPPEVDVNRYHRW